MSWFQIIYFSTMLPLTLFVIIYCLRRSEKIFSCDAPARSIRMIQETEKQDRNKMSDKIT